MTVGQFDNNNLPLTGIGLPYGSALGVYTGGVGGKVFDFYKEASGAK